MFVCHRDDIWLKIFIKIFILNTFRLHRQIDSSLVLYLMTTVPQSVFVLRCLETFKLSSSKSGR